ncbi:MAG: InlB B-repeat-containing protein [Chitinivibrionia bacterium]|nr:InlB B-repeat-containing protein [Chitinivibrionia bacterium]
MKRNKFLFGALLFLFALSGCSDFNVEYIRSEVEQNRTQYYTVTFNSNGGNSVSSQTVEYGNSVYLPTPTRSGYTFDGWYDYYGNTKYGNGGNYHTVYSDVSMYAQWSQIITYTITFNANGGSVSTSQMSGTYGTSITLPAPTRNGYIFNGWYSSSSGGTYYGDAGDYYTVYSNVTMYARWSPISYNTYTITFNANGGSVSISQMSGTSGSTITLPTPTRSGYIFNGWYSSSSGGTYYGDAGDYYTVYSNVTMYARWTYTGGNYLSNDYTGTYNGSLLADGFNQQATNPTYNGSSISGGNVNIPNVSISVANNLSDSPGTWSYIYSGNSKIGIAVTNNYNNKVYRSLILGKDLSEYYKSNSGYNAAITSDITNTYYGLLHKSD